MVLANGAPKFKPELVMPGASDSKQNPIERTYYVPKVFGKTPVAMYCMSLHSACRDIQHIATAIFLKTKNVYKS